MSERHAYAISFVPTFLVHIPIRSYIRADSMDSDYTINTFCDNMSILIFNANKNVMHLSCMQTTRLSMLHTPMPTPLFLSSLGRVQTKAA